MTANNPVYRRLEAFRTSNVLRRSPQPVYEFEELIGESIDEELTPAR